MDEGAYQLIMVPETVRLKGLSQMEFASDKIKLSAYFNFWLRRRNPERASSPDFFKITIKNKKREYENPIQNKVFLITILPEFLCWKKSRT
jgi:hypothetical protein